MAGRLKGGGWVCRRRSVPHRRRPRRATGFTLRHPPHAAPPAPRRATGLTLRHRSQAAQKRCRRRTTAASAFSCVMSTLAPRGQPELAVPDRLEGGVGRRAPNPGPALTLTPRPQFYAAPPVPRSATVSRCAIVFALRKSAVDAGLRQRQCFRASSAIWRRAGCRFSRGAAQGSRRRGRATSRGRSAPCPRGEPP